MSDQDDFFDAKRPWSRIKDQILSSYMTPYIAKIIKKGKPLIIIDAFAGAGKMATGEAGSPLIICSAADKLAKGKYKAYFVNKEEKYHLQLSAILQKGNFSAATPILGDGTVILREIIPTLSDESVFLYIDPFGLDCEFDILEPFLNRNPQYSTEILINIHMPIIHRLASRKAIQSGENETLIASYHERLTKTFGGDYWKDILLDSNIEDAKTREKLLIEKYMLQLSSTGYLKFTGACPVREKQDSRTKYYMVFASPHPDAMVLFNDNMCKSFNENTNRQEMRDTLFAETDWSQWRDTKKLMDIVIEYVSKYPKSTRLELWRHIVEDHFMLFMAKEYREAVKTLVDSEQIICSTPINKNGIRPTKSLNNDCILEPSKQQGLL